MGRDEFLKAVRERANLASREEAERATAAVLRTLGERLAGGEPHDLASQLPEELAGYVRREGGAQADPFPLEEFYRRVAEREGTDQKAAEDHARAVVGVLREAVTSGEIEDVRAQLPSEYAPLFGD